jgi:hypothetical protein
VFNECCNNATVIGNSIIENNIGVDLPLFPLGGISVLPGEVFYKT